jgi:HEAT repeat protein
MEISMRAISTTVVVCLFSGSAYAANVKANEFLSMPMSNSIELLKETKSLGLAKDFLATADDENLDMSTRWKALQLSAHAGGREFIPQIEKKLANSTWYMRNAALLAINSLDSIKGQQAAHILVSDKALVVRSAAVEVLKSRPETIDRARIWKELSADYNFNKGSSLWVRSQLAELLSLNPQKNEAQSFANMLEESDVRIQVAAMSSLEKVYAKKMGDDKLSHTERLKKWQQWWQKNNKTL